MVYGYARVSTLNQANKGTSLEGQEKELRENGAEQIFADAYTGTKMQRPEFDRLMQEIKPGDRLIVTKLDRIARTATAGYELIQDLLQKGVTVHVLNMGLLDNTPTGDLILHIFLAFAEFERAMIVQRTTEGRELAKQNGVSFGRKKKFTSAQIKHAVELTKTNTLKEVAEMTGISISTIKRARAMR